jgi:hypothetical protein
LQLQEDDQEPENVKTSPYPFQVFLGGCSPPPVLIQSPDDVRYTHQYRPLVCPIRPDGVIKGTEKTALRLINMGLKDEDVLKATLLSPQQLEEIKRNNNK